jgi:ligand-binding sensor domain-containing protein
LLRIRDGEETSISGLPDGKINCLLAGDGPEVWAGTDAGLIHSTGHELSREGVPSPIQRGQVLALARDRDRNLWVGTIDSLFRIDSHGSYDIEHLDNRQIGRANAIFEDRNGDLWVGGAHGIERYRESVFLTYRKAGNRPLDEGGPLFVDSSGRAWVGPASGGLSWLRGTASQSLEAAGLNTDVIYSIDGTADELWLGGRRGGLTALRTTPGAFSIKTYTTGDGLAPGSAYAVHRNRDGSVWVRWTPRLRQPVNPLVTIRRKVIVLPAFSIRELGPCSISDSISRCRPWAGNLQPCLTTFSSSASFIL